MNNLRIIILLIFLQSVHQINAQNITNQNNSWSVVECLNFGPCYTVNFYIGNDTIIDGKNYKAFHHNPPGPNHTAFHVPIAIREDSLKRVYFKFPQIEEDRMYYDFSLEVGDTAVSEIYGDFEVQFIVETVDSVTLQNGEKRKRIRSSNNWPAEEWIEGVGSMFGIIQTSYNYYIWDVYPRLLCFNENDTLKYLNAQYDTCYYETTNIEHLRAHNWSIFPNPLIDQAIMKSDSEYLKNGQIKVYDLNGRVVYQQVGITGNSIEINISELKSGFYIYCLYDENTLKFTQKLIKR